MVVDQAVRPAPANAEFVFFIGCLKRSIRRLLTRLRQTEMIFSVDDQAQALHTLHYALQQPEIWPEVRPLLLELAPLLEQAGYRDEWQPYLEQGLALSRRLTDLEAEAELALQLGVLCQLRSNYGAARQHLEASARHFATLSDPANQARAFNQLAFVAGLERHFEEANRLIETALMLLEDQAIERAFSYYVLGTIAFDMRTWAQAEIYFDQARTLWAQRNDERMLGRSLMSLCTVLLPQKKYQAALEAGRQAITIFEAVHDPVHRAISQMNLGNVYLTLGQSEQALELYQPAERVFRQTQSQLLLALVNHNMGMAYRHLKEWPTAEAAYQRSLTYQEQLGNLAWLINTMDGLGLLYLAQGQPEQAIVIFEAALTRLAKIEGQPRYDHLLAMLSEHLEDAGTRLNRQNTA